MYMESSWVDGTCAELVIVEDQVLKVSDRSKSVSRDAADGVLLQV